MIKLTTENLGKIADALEKANGKASAHTYRNPNAIIVLTETAENSLAALGLNKRDRAGAAAVYQSGEELPSAYKYHATTTTVTLLRRPGGWYLVKAYASQLWPRQKPCNRITLTSAQDAAAVAGFRGAYNVAVESEAAKIVADDAR